MTAGVSVGEVVCVLTREDVVQVPGQHGVQQRVQAHHSNGGQEGELVPLQGAGAHVVPLQAQALLLIAGQVLCAQAKRHLGQKALLEHTQGRSLEHVYGEGKRGIKELRKLLLPPVQLLEVNGKCVSF